MSRCRTRSTLALVCCALGACRDTVVPKLDLRAPTHVAVPGFVVNVVGPKITLRNDSKAPSRWANVVRIPVRRPEAGLVLAFAADAAFYVLVRAARGRELRVRSGAGATTRSTLTVLGDERPTEVLFYLPQREPGVVTYTVLDARDAPPGITLPKLDAQGLAIPRASGLRAGFAGDLLTLEADGPVPTPETNVVTVPVLRPTSGLLLRFEADDRFLVLVRDRHAKTLRSTGGSQATTAPRDLVALADEEPTEVLFYLPRTEAGRVSYRILAATDAPPGTIAPEVRAEHLAREMLAMARRRSGEAVFLVERGRSLRALAAGGDPGLADEVRRCYREWLSRSFRDVGDRDPRPIFAAAFAHCAVPLSSLGGTDAIAILQQGSGTCWQQVVVARWMLGVLDPRCRARLLCSDPRRNGHTLMVTDDLIVDVTADLVIPMAWRSWNALEDGARIELLERTALVGPQINDDAAALESYAFAPLIQFLPDDG